MTEIQQQIDNKSKSNDLIGKMSEMHKKMNTVNQKSMIIEIENIKKEISTKNKFPKSNFEFIYKVVNKMKENPLISIFVIIAILSLIAMVIK